MCDACVRVAGTRRTLVIAHRRRHWRRKLCIGAGLRLRMVLAMVAVVLVQQRSKPPVMRLGPRNGLHVVVATSAHAHGSRRACTHSTDQPGTSLRTCCHCLCMAKGEGVPQV